MLPKFPLTWELLTLVLAGDFLDIDGLKAAAGNSLAWNSVGFGGKLVQPNSPILLSLLFKCLN